MGRIKKIEVRVREPNEKVPVRIVTDAVVGTRGRHGGRMLLVLMLDTSERPDIDELIRAHQTMGPGDVKTQWGQVDGHDGTVALFLTFIRPVELFIVLEFDIAKRGFMIDQILTGQGFYLCKADDEEDRFSKNTKRANVVVEVPESGFQESWEKLFHKHLAIDFKKKGMDRFEAKRAARTTIAGWREIGRLRMRDVHPPE